MGNKISEGFGCGIPPMRDEKVNDLCRSFYVGMGIGLFELILGIILLVWMIMKWRKSEGAVNQSEYQSTNQPIENIQQEVVRPLRPPRPPIQKGGSKFPSLPFDLMMHIIAIVLIVSGVWIIAESMRGYYYLEEKPVVAVPILPNDGLFNMSCTDCVNNKKKCTWICTGKNAKNEDATCGVAEAEVDCLPTQTSTQPSVITTPPV